MCSVFCFISGVHDNGNFEDLPSLLISGILFVVWTRGGSLCLWSIYGFKLYMILCLGRGFASTTSTATASVSLQHWLPTTAN